MLTAGSLSLDLRTRQAVLPSGSVDLTAPSSTRTAELLTDATERTLRLLLVGAALTR